MKCTKLGPSFHQNWALVFTKTGDEMKSEDENSTQGQKKKKKKTGDQT
jgi:hypothetical protein